MGLGFALVLLAEGLGPGLDSTPARRRRVATSERGREEEKKGRGGRDWREKERVSGRRAETPGKKAKATWDRIEERKEGRVRKGGGEIEGRKGALAGRGRSELHLARKSGVQPRGPSQRWRLDDAQR